MIRQGFCTLLFALLFVQPAKAEVPAFPRDGGFADRARHCVTISAAIDLAADHGRALANQIESEASRGPLVLNRPSIWLLQVVGGQAEYDMAVARAQDMEQHWQAYGRTTWFAMITGATPYVTTESAPLVSAFIECLEYFDEVSQIYGPAWENDIGDASGN